MEFGIKMEEAVIDMSRALSKTVCELGRMQRKVYSQEELGKELERTMDIMEDIILIMDECNSTPEEIDKMRSEINKLRRYKAMYSETI